MSNTIATCLSLYLFTPLASGIKGKSIGALVANSKIYPR